LIYCRIKRYSASSGTIFSIEHQQINSRTSFCQHFAAIESGIFFSRTADVACLLGNRPPGYIKDCITRICNRSSSAPGSFKQAAEL
jgi:hypothetical protein